MHRAATVTQAQIARAMRAARRIDPQAVVEVTSDGIIRILPAQQPSRAGEVDEWFSKDDAGAA